AEAVKKLQAALLKSEQQSTSPSDEPNPTPDPQPKSKQKDPDAPDIGRKRKLKTLPEVERRALLSEREDLIAKYRAIKAARAEEG
ncbi:hypothetical protein HK097_005185, partial [Rhizophlyctis rosea]